MDLICPVCSEYIVLEIGNATEYNGSYVHRECAKAKEKKMEIKVSYRSVDGYSKTRTFKTLKYARKFAHEWVGEHPDIGGYYAVSFDGIGRITVSGDATLKDLFPEESEEEYEVFDW